MKVISEANNLKRLLKHTNAKYIKNIFLLTTLRYRRKWKKQKKTKTLHFATAYTIQHFPLNSCGMILFIYISTYYLLYTNTQHMYLYIKHRQWRLFNFYNWKLRHRTYIQNGDLLHCVIWFRNFLRKANWFVRCPMTILYLLQIFNSFNIFYTVIV